MNLVKSKKRVADHGEVFTPAWMVEAMLDLVKDETERIDSRFLEPRAAVATSSFKYSNANSLLWNSNMASLTSSDSTTHCWG